MENRIEESVKLLAQRLLEKDFSEIPERERQVIERVAKRVSISRNPDDDAEKSMTFGDRLADQVATFGGSWKFLILFGLFIFAWMAFNSMMLIWGFDPYPYILLNLFMSMLASVQAPVIMMSQNRQDTKDRLRGELDFDVNKRAESEIQAVSRKLLQLTDKIEDLQELVRDRRGPA